MGKLASWAKQLKIDLPAVFLTFQDKETPLLAKIFAALTLAYALSPVDLIPDFVPFLGYLDDLLLLPALIALTVHLVPPPLWERNRERAKDMWKDGKPKKWYFAVPIVLLWLLFAFWLLKRFW